VISYYVVDFYRPKPLKDMSLEYGE